MRYAPISRLLPALSKLGYKNTFGWRFEHPCGVVFFPSVDENNLDQTLREQLSLAISLLSDAGVSIPEVDLLPEETQSTTLWWLKEQA